MPEPVRKHAGTVDAAKLQARLTGLGSDPGDWPGAVAAAGQRRLTLLTMAPIAAGYEQEMTVHVWRDPASPWTRATRQHASRWLRFCESLGHVLSPIERAVATGTAYDPGDLAPKLTAGPGPAEAGGEPTADDRPGGQDTAPEDETGNTGTAGQAQNTEEPNDGQAPDSETTAA